MPLIKVQTSVAEIDRSSAEELLKELSAKLAKHLGKPESYVMTAFESNVPMTFAGTTEPVCYVEVKSIGKMGDRTKAMSQDFCQHIGTKLGIPPNRIYIEFADAQGSMWGWNGSTF
ncbi:MAG TPA: hypothetical protein IGS17_09020 [Oscillatoriales cyanobacterium M59_W2019_021]|nr:MAG: hypothetical protein D6728_09270 [Cyanobacteria bacterium J055]HIK31245.1 hypothetical protein [Oscillatoriales cyanobacterium M4454_W2019_049]HIK51048.1 hypothetical protein [Oscillatoriales cyanobacterium M59_W2019_021]